MAKNRANKARRHQATLNTKIVQRKPEDVIILEEVIPHKAYESILVVLDAEIQERTQLFRTGLKVARDMPIYTEPAELAEIDPYVDFYRGFLDANSEPLFSVAAAQLKAHGAYQGQLEDIAKSSMVLALLYYTSFVGDVPDVEPMVSDEEMSDAGLPPNLKRGMWSPLEQKLNHVKHMSLTDEKFAAKLTTAINAAVAKAAADGLMGEQPEEDVSGEGFQPPATD